LGNSRDVGSTRALALCERTSSTSSDLCSFCCEIVGEVAMQTYSPLQQAFATCQAAKILVPESCSCCRRCNEQMLQRIEACASCRGMYTGYVMYIVQAAIQAIKEGDLWLCYGSAVKEVCALSACLTMSK